ncbi:glycosyltransferase [Mucilaginibacter ginsenosidivorax]|uniref:Glycosyltransferase n=1 Tax=Mucilaginibacter ginsenosidivorax TaxID=862126 RepID=A0A5B8W4Q8_9SPHI|nr:glycosyltransferase [Mucilaginibacter ginsenosidivorax]QEC77906.1 glycosyltransferase [Mucilaginibacter ginsenosidivorax]
MPPYSFIILTYNEEQHLPRLLESIAGLNAPVFILDSGSDDDTILIAQKAGASILQHAFENHPKQWDFALKNFDIKTPWVVCLDADQVITPELREKLANFKDQDYQDIDGIYFNRKNFFKGSWIKHGGYYPFYLLKMIRFGVGYSDLNENMDHRFIVPGKTVVWKDGHILEENLKENNISFWIAKHNRYSDLLAQEEVERMQKMRQQTLKPSLFGSPDERTAWLKQLWWQLPRYVRPLLYFTYRMIFQLGILEGRIGVIFHFLQGFWFRLIVDVKIDEILKNKQPGILVNTGRISPGKFVFRFLFLFLLFYYFNILFFGITNPGSHYYPFLANHLNYIQGLRWLLLSISTQVLNGLGFSAIHNGTELLVAGKGAIILVYSCLGLGLMSFFAAFVIAYPKKTNQKLIFLTSGILVIQLLNILRFVLLALFWNKDASRIVDHHTIFNIILYTIIMISLYFWVKQNDEHPNKHA